MKLRQDFITNSSSSSYIIINTKDGYETLSATEIYLIGELGKTEFGWEIENTHDIHSRINFAYIQAHSINNQEWLNMLDKVIKENSNIKELIYCIGDYNGKNWGYIDHQSNACESENIEMFENEEILKDFIFGKNSYIHTDNDNH